MLRKKIASRREQLTEFDEGWAELLQLARQAIRIGAGAVRFRHRLASQHFVEAGPGDEIRPPVFEQDQGKIAIPLEAIGPE